MGWEREVPSCGIKQCSDPDPPRRVNVTEDFGLGYGEEPSRIVEEIGGMVSEVSVSSVLKCRLLIV